MRGTTQVATGARSPDRLYSIDVLRGFASLSVVLWHWQHFSYAGTLAPGGDRATQPFYAVLVIPYEYGHFGVELFFMISGFVFFWLYGDSIHSGKTTCLSFIVSRFSRLYPLHLICLISVALLQLIHRSTLGVDFVYGNNDAFHFILGLLFVNGWGFERGYSFNGPTWSVSVEVLLYGVFFAFAIFRPTWDRAVFAAGLGGIVSLKFGALGGGILCFFAGGTAYFLADRLASRFSLPWLCLLFAGVGALNLALLPFHPTAHVAAGFTAIIPQFAPLTNVFAAKALLLWIVVLLFFPGLSLLAAIELKRGPTGRCLAWIGDITYSTYLLHFPLQIIFVLTIGAMWPKLEIVESWVVLVAYFTVLVSSSLVAYNCFELPAQHAIRRAFRQFGERRLNRLRLE